MKMKKFISISMLIIIIVSSALITSANDPSVISLQINNNLAFVNGQSTQLATSPYIDTNSGRALVPLRFVAEEMGYDVEWYNSSKRVHLSKTIENTDNTITKNIIEIQINNNTARQYTFGARVGFTESIELEQPPVIKDGYTMVPIRFIAEEMGYDVEWNGTSKTITIREMTP